MLIVHVKHYLTHAGIEYFNAEWFPAVKARISKQIGFIDISHAAEKDKDDCVNIIVKFTNEEKINAWAEHAEHDVFVNQLDKYRSRDYWEAVRTENETADAKDLVWQRIKPINT